MVNRKQLDRALYRGALVNGSLASNIVFDMLIVILSLALGVNVISIATCVIILTGLRENQKYAETHVRIIDMESKIDNGDFGGKVVTL